MNTYSMKVHEIVGRKGKQFVLDNGKAFYEEQLVKANKEENLSELKRKHKQIQDTKKRRRKRSLLKTLRKMWWKERGRGKRKNLKTLL